MTTLGQFYGNAVTLFVPIDPRHSECRKCRVKIAKGETPWGVLNPEYGNVFGPYHKTCAMATAADDLKKKAEVTA